MDLKICLINNGEDFSHKKKKKKKNWTTHLGGHTQGIYFNKKIF
jgi:hypothetical protein